MCREILVIMSFLPAAQGNVEFFWDDPRKVGSLVKNPDGTSYYRGPGTGTSSFITHSRLQSRNFIKGNKVIFLLSLEGEFGPNTLENIKIKSLQSCKLIQHLDTNVTEHYFLLLLFFLIHLLFLLRCDWTFRYSACTSACCLCSREKLFTQYIHRKLYRSSDFCFREHAHNPACGWECGVWCEETPKEWSNRRRGRDCSRENKWLLVTR